jgi:hypothetical protein
MEPVQYKTTRLPGHPLAGINGYVRVHRLVLYQKIGPGEQRCHWCGCPLQWMVGVPVNTPRFLIADHVDEDTLNNGPDNIVPSCSACNSGRSNGQGRIKAGELFLVVSNGRARRAAWFNCSECRKSYLSLFNLSGRPYKATCSKSCANVRRSRLTQGISKPRQIEGLVVFWGGQRCTAKEKTCLACGKRFLVPASTPENKGKVCSHSCRAAYNRLRANTPWVQRECEVCGAEFKFPEYELKFHPFRTCSKKCAGILRFREGKRYFQKAG